MSAIPKTFKDICESVLEESDGRAIQLASVSLGRDTSGDLYLEEPTHRNIVAWVAEEYLRIQLETPLWSFLNKRGIFLNIAADKESYIKPGVRRVDAESLYFVPTGQTIHYPLIMQPYDWWQYEERDGITSSAPVPTTLVNGPEDEWIVWPVPSVAGTVQGDWAIDPNELINSDDTPCWDKQYNPMLKWGVIQMYAAEFAGEKSAPKLQRRAERMLPRFRLAFEDEYLPIPKGPASLF